MGVGKKHLNVKMCAAYRKRCTPVFIMVFSWVMLVTALARPGDFSRHAHVGKM